MAFNLDSITKGTRQRPPRIILLGVEKIGKSTFAAGSDRPIFLPVKGEEGIDELEVPQFPASQSLADAQQALYSLYQGGHDYGTVVIDSASALEPLVWAETCRANGNAESIEKVGGGYGKGYTEAVSSWRMITEALDALRSERDMASIIIGHVRVKRHDDPIDGSYDTYQFDIHEKAANLLYRWSDLILFAKGRAVVKSEDVGFNKEVKRAIDISAGQRFVYTQKRASHPGGGRGVFGRLPYELPLDWQAFTAAVAAAS